MPLLSQLTRKRAQGSSSTETTSCQVEPGTSWIGMQGIMNKHFESKHIMVVASSESGKSLVMWNRKIVPLDEY